VISSYAKFYVVAFCPIRFVKMQNLNCDFLFYKYHNIHRSEIHRLEIQVNLKKKTYSKGSLTQNISHNHWGVSQLKKKGRR
jgi:hypothetical protein